MSEETQFVEAKPVKNRFDRKRLNHYAGEILAFVSSLDPTWESRLQIVKEDLHLDNLQTLGNLIARPLDRGEHTVVASHPFFESNYVPPDEKTVCPVCLTQFDAAYPGQPVCSNACAKTFYAKETVKAA